MVLIVPAPADFRAQKEAVLNPFSVGTGDHLSSVWVWGPLPQKYSLPLGLSESWKAAGKCSSATEHLNSSQKANSVRWSWKRGSLAHLRDGGLEGKKSFSVKKICSGFEAFSKCNWASAAPSATAAGDFTSREGNTFMQNPLPCT